MGQSFDRIQSVFTAASALLGEQRAAYLDHACGSDVELRREVESLLMHANDPILETPALGAGFCIPTAGDTDDMIPASPPATPPSAPATPSELPAKVGKYAIMSELGRGGQATVYRAVHPTLASDVVVKVLNVRPGASEATSRSVLADEGKTLAELAHPNVARVFDLDVFEGRPFLVMEFVRGRNLKQYSSGRPVEPRTAARLVAQAGRGLGAAHRAGVVHLDVKPLNLLMAENSAVKVIDFGVAKARGAWQEDSASLIGGTLLYFAPEQAMQMRQGPTDLAPQADVFALGAVLFFLLTGKDAYGGIPPEHLLDRLIKADFDRGPLETANVPSRLRAICFKAMSADPAKRYADGDEMAAALERFAEPRRVLAWAAGAVGVLLLVAAIGAAWPKGSPPVLPPDPLAQRQPEQVVLNVDVRRGDGWLPLSNAGPLVDGDLIRLHCNVPAGLYASLVSQDSEGNVSELANLKAEDATRELRFPEAGKAVPLKEPAGTEVIIVLTRREGPVDVLELKRSWPTPGAWPNLHPGAVGRRQGDKAEILNGTRGLGAARDLDDPGEKTLKRLALLAQGLQGKVSGFTVITFTHTASN